MALPFQNLNWSKWLEGLLDSTLGAVGTGGAGYFATLITGHAPDWAMLWTMLLISASWNFFSYLKDHRLISEVIVETKTIKTTEITPGE